MLEINVAMTGKIEGRIGCVSHQGTLTELEVIVLDSSRYGIILLEGTNYTLNRTVQYERPLEGMPVVIHFELSLIEFKISPNITLLVKYKEARLISKI